METSLLRREFNAATMDADVAAAAFAEHGVILVRGAIAQTAELQRVREYCTAFGEVMKRRVLAGEQSIDVQFFRTGDGSRPHECVYENFGFIAPIVPLLAIGPAWPVIERLCGSTDLAVPIDHHILRRIDDRREHFTEAQWNSKPIPADVLESMHQDAHLVNPDLPVTVWVALQDSDVGPGSALGIVPGKFQRIFTAPVREDEIDDEFAEFWKPSFKVGDVAIFSCKTPHFTARYGNGIERYSVDFRVSAAAALPPTLIRAHYLQIRTGGGQTGFALNYHSPLTDYSRTLTQMLQRNLYMMPPVGTG